MPHPKKNAINIVFLNENPLPKIFTKGTISGKELRLRSAISQIDQVHVIARSGESVNLDDTSRGEFEEKIVVHRLPPWPYYLSAIPLFVVGLYWSIKTTPVIIEAESPLFSGPAAILISKILKIPTNIEVRSNFSKLSTHKLKLVPESLKVWLVKLIENWVLSSASFVTFNSRFLQQEFKSITKTSAIINPGIQYPPKVSKKKINKKETFGYLGRLVPEKSVDLLLEAMFILQANQNLPSYKLEVAGSGPELNKLQSLVKEYHLEDQVTFLGQSSNFKTLSRWDFLVNPNTVQAPLEMVNAEAAWCGVPVICFGTDKIPETVLHQRTGIKVYQPTAFSLSQAITKLIQEPKLRTKLSKTSVTFAQKNFQFESQVRKLKQMYQQLDLI